MTNNDFDFIKQKFDESGVNAPEQLNEEYVKEKIESIEPLKVKKSKAPIIGGISVAAAVAVFLVNALIFSNVLSTFINNPESLMNLFKVSQTTNATTAEIKSFGSNEEIKEAIQKIFEVQSSERYYDGSKTYSFGNDIAEEYALGSADSYSAGLSGSSGSSGSSSGSSHNSTYIQEIGVDEADSVKTDGEYIYYMTSYGDKIYAIKTDNGKTQVVSEVEPPQSPKESYSTFSDFYINNNKLITIMDSSLSYHSVTVVSIFDITDKSSITLEDRFSQSGYYCSSRMIGSMLYVVSTHYAYDDNVIPYCYGGAATSDEAVNTLAADCVYSVQNPSDSSFSVISCIDTDKSAQAVKTKAILGSADDIYCTTENLYITALEYENVYKDNFITKRLSNSYYYYDYYDQYEYTQIIKVTLNDELDFAASSRVMGAVNNQYSLDEHDGNLRVATTAWNDNYGKETNNLYVLDSSLKELGKVTGFAENESIQAVRYIGDTAYVITYEQTDPLFVIDLSDPYKPEITGEVKISGFSTLLVPVDENTLLGIGYHTYDPLLDGIGVDVHDGLKIVTFDISDKNNPTVIDSKIFEYRDSQVQYNPKALLVNFERGDYTIPYNYACYNSYYNDNPDDDKLYSGIINFRIDNGKINIVDDYISEKFGRDMDNVVLDRCVYIGDYIYMVGDQTNVYYADYYYDYDNDVFTTDSTLTIDSVKYK